MKKCIACLLAAVLVLSCVCRAEAVQTDTYVSVTGKFTFDLPYGYLVLSSNIIRSLMQASDDAGLADRLNITPEEAQNLISVRDTLDLDSIDYIQKGLNGGTVNMILQENTGIFREYLSFYRFSLDEQFLEQYAMMGIPKENVKRYDIIHTGHYDWYKLSLVMGDVTLVQYMTANDETDLLTVTFTNINDEDTEFILSSILFI